MLIFQYVFLLCEEMCCTGMAATLQHRCRAGMWGPPADSLCPPPQDFSLFLCWKEVWKPIGLCSYRVRSVLPLTRLQKLRSCILQLNTVGNWLSASKQILVLLLAVSTGSLGRKKTSVTRQSIQSHRQCWVLHGDLWAMRQLVSYSVITPLVSTYCFSPLHF